jgi:MinD-like ATPase involved in chromosome partitioning or flagellar assembly
MGVRLIHRTAFMNALASEGHLDSDAHEAAWPEAYRQFDYVLFSLPYRRLREMGPLVKWISLCMTIAPEDSAGMLETYTTFKDFNRRSPETDLGMIVYTGDGETAAREAFHRMARNVKRFLRRELLSYAFIPKGQKIKASLEETAPLVLKWPSSVIRKHLFTISGLVLGDYAAKDPEPPRA